MTLFEWLLENKKDMVLESLSKGKALALIKTNEKECLLNWCSEITCERCMLNSNDTRDCSFKMQEWLMQELDKSPKLVNISTNPMTNSITKPPTFMTKTEAATFLRLVIAQYAVCASQADIVEKEEEALRMLGG